MSVPKKGLPANRQNVSFSEVFHFSIIKRIL